MACNQPVAKESLLVIPAFEFPNFNADVFTFLKHVREHTDLGVKVVIAFPGLTNGEQVLKKFFVSGNSTGKEQTKDGQTTLPTYTLVGTTLTDTYQIAMRINEIFTSAQNNCAVNISLVNLFSFSSPDEALTVQARPPQTGIVYFKTFKSNRDLDDYSYFFRVQFFLKKQFVIIWIVLATLEPIGIYSNNELHAAVPKISTNTEPPPNDRLHWLSVLLANRDNSQYQPWFFSEGGTDSKAIIHPSKNHNNSQNPRVCKGEVRIESHPIAVIADGNTEFVVHEMHEYEFINAVAY